MKLKASHHHWLMLALVFLGAYVLYTIYKTLRAGLTDVGSILMALFHFAAAAWTQISGAASGAASSLTANVSAAASLPSLTTTELANANAQLGTAQSYKPGGAMYQQILNSQGQAAADKAAAQALANAQNEQSQAQSNASWWGFGNLFSHL